MKCQGWIWLLPLTGPRSRLTYSVVWLIVLAAFLTCGCAIGGQSGEQQKSPQLDISPASFNFGDVAIGSSKTQTFNLTNTGNASLTVNQANVSGAGFTISGLAVPDTLGPGEFRLFSVRFAPNAVGSVTGSVSVFNTASSLPNTLSLVGNGVTAIAHSVNLAWDASTSLVVGYNVYRADQPSGFYTKLNPSLIVATTYTDNTVEAGRTYFYVATAVDAIGIESAFSNEAVAAIPTP